MSSQCLRENLLVPFIVIMMLASATVVRGTKLVLTGMPPIIPGKFTVFEYDTKNGNTTALISGDEQPFTAYSFVSGAAVCGKDLYYTVWTDVPMTWGIAVFDLKHKKTLIIDDWSQKADNHNLIHNIWCDPSDITGKTLLTVQSSMVETVNQFSVHRVVFDIDKLSFTSTELVDLKGVQDRFFGVDYEFSLSSDGTEIWSLWTNLNFNKGTLTISNLETGNTDHIFTTSKGLPNVGYLGFLGKHDRYHENDKYTALYYKHGQVGAELYRGEFSLKGDKITLVTRQKDIEGASDLYVTSMPSAICNADGLSYVIRSSQTTDLLIVDPKTLKKQEIRTLKLQDGQTFYTSSGAVACVN